MQEKRKKDKFYTIDINDNPFVNDKIYPITGLMTTTCLDQYIGTIYRPYSGYFIHDRSPTIDEKYSSITKELQEYSDILRENITKMNDDKLKFLNNAFNDLSTMMKDSFDEVMKDAKKSNKKVKIYEHSKDLAETVYGIRDDIMDASFRIERKKIYLESLEKLLTNEIIRRIDVFDKYGNGTGILVDINELTCIQTKQTTILKPDTRLNKTEKEVIKHSARDIFRAMEKAIGMQFDNIFVQYIHVTMTFGHRPFGLLMTDKFMCPEGSLVDYYNSQEVREMLDNGFLYNYLDSAKFGEDDEDIPFDDDDDWEDDDDDDID